MSRLAHYSNLLYVHHYTCCSVHGEFRFSPLPMPPPRNASSTGGRLSGEDMQRYMPAGAGPSSRGIDVSRRDKKPSPTESNLDHHVGIAETHLHQLRFEDLYYLFIFPPTSMYK